MATPPLDATVKLRLTTPEREWFHEIAQAQGLTLSDLIRHSIALEGARIGVPAPVREVAPVT